MTNVPGHKLHHTHNPDTTVQQRSFVTLHYVGKLADGTIFESTNKKPLHISVGEHAVISGLEEGLLGMHVGEKKRIIVHPEKGYGKYHKDLVQEVPLHKIPPEITPSIGMVINQETKTGRTLFMTVIKINRESIVVDLNHPLAGKTLVFDLVVMDIQ
jgi:FKBP-type peptidyl-prolyl cis-trans isomerase 2